MRKTRPDVISIARVPLLKDVSCYVRLTSNIAQSHTHSTVVTKYLRRQHCDSLARPQMTTKLGLSIGFRRRHCVVCNTDVLCPSNSGLLNLGIGLDEASSAGRSSLSGMPPTMSGLYRILSARLVLAVDLDTRQQLGIPLPE